MIAGHQGDDVLIGGTGGDCFDFGLGHGNNIIVDFEDGIDVIGLRDGLSFEQLTISQIGDDTRIFADQLSITLQGVADLVIGADDFIQLTTERNNLSTLRRSSSLIESSNTAAIRP